MFPSVQTLGYFRESLRDKEMRRLSPGAGREDQNQGATMNRPKIPLERKLIRLRRACSELLKGQIAQLPESPADEPPAQPQHNSRKEELLRKAMGLIGSGKVTVDDPRCASLSIVEHR